MNTPECWHDTPESFEEAPQRIQPGDPSPGTSWREDAHWIEREQLAPDWSHSNNGDQLSNVNWQGSLCAAGDSNWHHKQDESYDRLYGQHYCMNTTVLPTHK